MKLFLGVFLLCFVPFVLAQSRDWWRTAVFYQIYPRSFKDSNNDGVGDLQGIISKLDHLVDAGVTATWLSPIFTSPMVDHGYDISDYRDIDPIFGNLDDFRQLLQEAHSRGIKVILDYVPNHTSDKHEWFEKSERREPGYENYYIWVDGKEGNTKPPNNWISHFHGSAWTYSPIRDQWYLHQFAAGQPDLNFRDPAVVQEMKDVLTFWMEMGVDGFRIDTIPSLFEREDLPDEPLSGKPGFTPDDYDYLLHPHTEDQPETYDMVYQWREVLDNFEATHGGDQRIIMTETYSPLEKLLAYYGNETHDGAHFAFNFHFITKLNRTSTARDIEDVIEWWMNNLPPKYNPNWVLGNHDQHRVASRYGPERADGLAMISMFLPGIGVTYNGDEWGMEDGEVTWPQGQDPQACNGRPEDFDLNSRDFQRTPLQWDDTVNAGFNDGAPTWLPVSPKYHECNLASQTRSTAPTHYRTYKKLISLRKSSETLQRGSLETFSFSTSVLGLKRTLANNPSYVLVVNIGEEERSVDLNFLAGLPPSLKVQIASKESNRNEGDDIETDFLVLAPYESLILVSS